MTRSETFYAIEVRPKSGAYPHLAFGPQAGPLLFYWRKPAVAFKRDLCNAHIQARRVVKVRITYTWS